MWSNLEIRGYISKVLTFILSILDKTKYKITNQDTKDCIATLFCTEIYDIQEINSKATKSRRWGDATLQKLYKKKLWLSSPTIFDNWAAAVKVRRLRRKTEGTASPRKRKKKGSKMMLEMS